MADNFASFLSNLRKVEKEGKYTIRDIDSVAERLEEDNSSIVFDNQTRETFPFSTGRNFDDNDTLNSGSIVGGKVGYFPSSTIGERQYNDTGGRNLLEGSTISTLSGLTSSTAMPVSPKRMSKGKGIVKKGGSVGSKTMSSNRKKSTANKSNKILLKSMQSTSSTNTSSIIGSAGMLDSTGTSSIPGGINSMTGTKINADMPSGTDFDAWLSTATNASSTDNISSADSSNLLQNLKSVTRLTRPSLRRIHDDLRDNTQQFSLADQEKHTAALMADLVRNSTLLQAGDVLPRHLREFKKGYTKIFGNQVKLPTITKLVDNDVRFKQLEANIALVPPSEEEWDMVDTYVEQGQAIKPSRIYDNITTMVTRENTNRTAQVNKRPDHLSAHGGPAFDDNMSLASSRVDKAYHSDSDLSANSADYSDTDSEEEDERTNAEKEARAALKKKRSLHRRKLERKREEKRRLMTYGDDSNDDIGRMKNKAETGALSKAEQRRLKEEAEVEALAKYDDELLSLSNKSIQSTLAGETILDHQSTSYFTKMEGIKVSGSFR